MNKLLLSLLLMAATAGARVEWAQTEAVLQVHPTQASAAAVFEFTNIGEAPVSFADIELSCGCLVVKPLKPSYAPGEKGQLVITLNLENRFGKLHKRIVAHTLDGQKTELIVAADIPRAFTFGTPLINWKKGDDSTEKHIRLHNPNVMPIKLLSISSSNELLPAELKTIREGFEYEVVVLRDPGGANARAVLQIHTEPPPGLVKSKAIKLYVSAR